MVLVKITNFQAVTVEAAVGLTTAIHLAVLAVLEHLDKDMMVAVG